MARGGKGGGGSGARAGKGGGGAGGASSASAGSVRAGGAFVELFTKDTKLKSGLKSASDMLRSWGSKMAAAGGVLMGAGAAIAAPLGALLSKAVGRAENIGDIADVFGLSAESASKMSSAFELAGGSIEELNMALSKLALANSEGKPLDQFFKEQAAAIGAIDDATERYQAAAAIFGNKFAGKFVDSSGDVLELLENAPALTKQSLDSAKAFRMEWTRVGIVLQDGMLPVLQVLNPLTVRISEFAKQNVGLLPTIAAVSVGVIGAGAALVGFGAVLSAAGVALGAVGTAVGVILSPVGLLTAGLAAGGLAWLNYTDSGQKALGTMTEGALTMRDRFGEAVANIRDGFEGGGITLALKALKAELEFVWAELTAGLGAGWASMLAKMKDLLVAFSYTAKDIFSLTTGVMATGMAVVAEKVGLVDEGTASAVANDTMADRDRIRNEAVAESQRIAGEKNAAVAAAQKQLDEARAALAAVRGEVRDAKRAGGVDFGFDLNPALAAAGMGGAGSSRGAFNFANAAQVFGGGNSLQEKQLKAIDAVKLEVGKVVDAITKMPMARIT